MNQILIPRDKGRGYIISTIFSLEIGQKAYFDMFQDGGACMERVAEDFYVLYSIPLYGGKEGIEMSGGMDDIKTMVDWGIVDVDYCVTKTVTLPKINGKRVQKKVWTCPYYKKWYAMLSRVFSHSYHKRRPNYIGCSICEGWRKLSDFIKWVDSQPNKDWENCEPDKDLLFHNNKIYSPDTVVFVDHITNKFILDSANKRGEYLLGVDTSRGRFRARCKDPFNLQSPWIGYFESELEAHKAWQAKKHEYACQLAEKQTDERVAFVLRNKYTPDKDWTNR